MTRLDMFADTFGVLVVFVGLVAGYAIAANLDLWMAS